MNQELEKAYENMGKQNEIIFKPIISNIYGNVLKTKYQYSRIDFLGNQFRGELKSRDIDLKYIPDAMVGFNKITYAFKYLNENPDCKFYFWFAFYDGLYVWEMNDENYKLNGGASQKKWGGTNNRGYDDYKYHYYIKKEFLTKIDDTPVFIDPIVRDNSKKKFKSSIPDGVCWIKLTQKELE
jgi:hypothetical protein